MAICGVRNSPALLNKFRLSASERVSSIIVCFKCKRTARKRKSRGESFSIHVNKRSRYERYFCIGWYGSRRIKFKKAKARMICCSQIMERWNIWARRSNLVHINWVLHIFILPSIGRSFVRFGLQFGWKLDRNRVTLSISFEFCAQNNTT